MPAFHPGVRAHTLRQVRFYAITSRFALPGEHLPGKLSAEEEQRLLALVGGWAGGVDWVQLREKDLSPAQLLQLALRMRAILTGSGTRLLLNGPASVAIAAGLHGLHLPGGWTVEAIAQARSEYAAGSQTPLLSVACHSLEDAHRAHHAGVDLALFAPVFGKKVPGTEASLPGQGIGALAACCRAAAPVPVFALGGIDAENAACCLRAGAAGVAAIRLFLDDRWRPLAQVE